MISQCEVCQAPIRRKFMKLGQTLCKACKSSLRHFNTLKLLERASSFIIKKNTFNALDIVPSYDKSDVGK